jgi:hypothetical protein
VTGSKIGIKSTSVSNRSNIKKVTMTTMVPITTNLTDSILLKGGGGVQCRRSQGLFPRLEEGALAPELQAVGNREV